MWYRNTDTTYNSIIITQPRLAYMSRIIQTCICTNAHAKAKSPQWDSVCRLRTALMIKTITCFWRLLLRKTFFFLNHPYRRVQAINSLWGNTVFYEDHCKQHIDTRNDIHPRLLFYHTCVALAGDSGIDLFGHARAGYRSWIGQIKTPHISRYGGLNILLARDHF